MSTAWKSFLVLFLPGLVVLLVLESLLRPNLRERNYEIFTEMAYSVANETQRPSASLPGQMTQQAVVDGVVVRGRMPFHYGPGPEEAQRAGRELLNPFASDDAVLERDGVTVAVDPMSIQYLVGAQVDYKEDLQGARFIINNPNASTTCGCGSSFSI